ncbi:MULTISPECIES: TIR domain-containing protein [Vibrio]|uniref:TIR domain-containing protein n=1 Tax=Vibrio TaxID=662 RepID=UPI001592CCF7|nr:MULTISPECIES: TIR domain-containing protein [Vibrio]MCA4023783.1 nucleotide-binding protein [Vibrio vulnificus]NVC65326.1 tetratricopeptide repeat protein [Vibrio sp. 05-20-BW147]
MKPKLFIGSSVEGLGVAYAIQQNLTHTVEATVWDQGVFSLSQTTIDSLEQVLESADFGVFVFSPDDITLMRNNENKTVRDNVLFEFGLFVGKLGRNRVFFVTPDGSDTYIPTDLLGITAGKYDPNRHDGSLQAATGAACNEIRQAIKKLGSLHSAKTENESVEDSSLPNNIELEWIHDVVGNQFDAARTKLTKLKEGASEEESLRHDLWLRYVDFKENDFKGLSPLIEQIKKSSDYIKLQVLGLNMLLWESYEDVALELIREHFDDGVEETSILIVKSACLDSIGDKDGAVSSLLPYQNSPEVSLKLSELYQSTGDKDKALDIISSAYRSFPSNKDLVYRYSRLLIESGANKEAAYLLNYLTIEVPDNAEYWGYLSNVCLTLDLYDRAMFTCKKAVELSSEKSSWVLHNIGNMLNIKGFYTDAIEWLEKGVSLDSSSEYGHSRLASSIRNQAKETETFSNICKEGRVLIRQFRTVQK